MIELPGSLVSPAWLAGHLDDVVVVDVRWYMDGRSGHDAWKAGHLPGAVWLDLDADLSAPAATPGETGGRHPLPTPDDFAASLSRVGIGDGSVVVAYDDVSGSRASRLWWMLRSLDQSVAVLDGGMQAWTGGLTTVESAVSPATFTPRPWPQDALVSGDDVADRLGRANVVMIDARSAARFRGEDNPIDNRLGHIPGARSAPWNGNVIPAGDDPLVGSMADTSALRDRFAALGVNEADEIILSCGSGVTACHNALALDQLGIDARIYVGSWSEWGSNPDRPLAVGSPGDSLH